MSESKVCTACKKNKSLDSFRVRDRDADSSSECKKCLDAAGSRAYYWKNKKAVLAANKKYREVNSEKLLSSGKEYRTKNAAKIKERKRKYYIRNAKHIKAKSSRRYETHKPEINAVNKKYREDNIEAAIAYNKEYRKANKDSIRIKSKQYQADNKESLKAKAKARYQRNKAVCQAKQKEYRKAHPEKIRVQTRRRRARKASVNENFTAAQAARTRELFQHQCFNCGSTANLAIDHNLPLSQGNALTPSNAAVLCKSCNSSKGTRLPQDFYTPEQLKKLNALLKIASENDE